MKEERQHLSRIGIQAILTGEKFSEFITDVSDFKPKIYNFGIQRYIRF